MILEFIFAIFGFLFSWMGFFVFLLGLLLFLMIATVPMLTGVGKRLANIHLWLAMWLVKRGSIVVSEHNDLLFKRMQFDDLGVETMSFGSETKQFEDPATALHTWMGFPFALADEVHGLLFDPRHAAIGSRKWEAEEHGEMYVRATDSEWDAGHEVYGWVRGVFEFPKDAYELVDLSRVRQVVTGTERAEYPARIETMYKNSRIPYASRTPITRIAMPIVAFLAVLGGIWVITSQGGGSGDSGSGSVIGYGTLLVLGTQAVDGEQLKKTLKIVAVGAPIPLVFVLVGVFVSPVVALIAFFVFGLGFLFLPILTFVARPSAKISGGLARFYLKLGLLGYKRPVFEWTPAKYRLREFDELGDVENVKWYSLAGSLIGFSFDPDPESWGPELIDASEIENRSHVRADGGSTPTNIPSGYTRLPDMTRAVYAAFVPQRLKSRSYYLRTDIALSRFTNAATGEKSLRKLLAAKDKYGEGGWGLSDKAVLYMTMGGAVLGAAVGVLFFLL